MNKIFSFFYNPFTRFVHESWAILLPKIYVKYIYIKIMHKKLNLDNPKDLNEKIQWLKIYSDLSLWTAYADKYNVRSYIEQCGLSNILVKLYGVWDNANEIDFNKLPEKFILKTNNAFSRSAIIRDKSKINTKDIVRQFNKWIKDKYGLVSFEPHYWNIKRKIIAEELLEDEINNKLSSSLIDYKFWCFHGEPYIVMVLYDRPNRTNEEFKRNKNTKVQACVYDLNWDLRPEIIAGSHANDKPIILSRPKCFEEMINVCKTLSKPFAQVRVDLYEVNNKVYFGELTFSSLGGYMDYFSQEYLLKMGDKINLSAVERRTKKFIV